MHKHGVFFFPAVIFFMMSPLALGVEGGDHTEKRQSRLPAPPLSLEQLLQAPPKARADLSALKGKVVVVHFWSTLCAPCIASRPKLNKLRDKFRDQPVIFLSITDEKRSVVTRHLQDHPIHGWVGLDTDRSTFAAYGVRGIPRTAVIDRSGNLAGWTTSGSLYEQPEILEKVIRGDLVTLSATAELEKMDLFADFMTPGRTPQGKTQVPLCLILIRPASGVDLPIGGSSRERRADNVTLRGMVNTFFPAQWAAISFEFTPSDDKYDVFFRWPKGDLRRGEALLRDAIRATFDLTIQEERRSTDVYVLSVEKGRETSWELSGNSASFDKETGNVAPNRTVLDRMNAGESFFLTMGSMENFADGLSYALGRPVIDESAVDGYYTFYFPWSKETSSSSEVIQKVKDKYGVILTPTQREIQVLVVRKGED